MVPAFCHIQERAVNLTTPSRCTVIIVVCAYSNKMEDSECTWLIQAKFKSRAPLVLKMSKYKSKSYTWIDITYTKSVNKEWISVQISIENVDAQNINKIHRSCYRCCTADDVWDFPISANL